MPDNSVVLLLLILMQGSDYCLAACAEKNQEWQCPVVCSCWNDAERSDSLTVDCSERNLNSIPDFPENVSTINLSKNQLTSINEKDFKRCYSLQNLYMDHNNLVTLHDDSLRDLINIRVLSLNDNKLIINTTEPILNTLIKLKALKLHNNNNINDTILANITSLETLTIDRNMKNVSFYQQFQTLSNLTRLEIYGNFQRIPNETFRNLANSPLKELHIKSGWLNSGNTLSELQPLSFSYLHQLEVLNISDNRGIGFHNVSRAWLGLCSNTSIRSLLLNRIVAHADEAPNISKSFYENLENCKSIRELRVGKNNIVSVAKGLAKAFPNIEIFDFSYNRISNILSLLMEIVKMRHLRFMDISYQSKRYMKKRNAKPGDSSSASTVNGSRKTKLFANISFANSAYQDQGNSEYCYRAYRPCNYPKLQDIIDREKKLPLPENGAWCYPIPSKLEIINASNSLNVQVDQLPENIILVGLNSKLREFKYRYNGVSQLTGPLLLTMSRRSQPIKVDFSFNGLNCISRSAFKRSSTIGGNIGHILMEGNNLGDQLASDFNATLLQQFKDDNLTLLSLAQNNIKSLPQNIFKPLNQLQTLNLSKNSLRILDLDFDHMKNLTDLDLSENLITVLDSSGMTNLENSFSRSNMTFYFSGNPIQCSCETYKFLQWIDGHKTNIKHLDRISCLINGTQFSFNGLSTDILPLMKSLCSDNLVLKISAALLAVIILAIAVSIFLYRHRWDIRYWILRFRAPTIPDALYEYDAFISYEHKNFNWVSLVLQKLEMKPTNSDSTETLENSSPDASELLAGGESEDVDAPLIDLSNSTEMIENTRIKVDSLKFCLADRDFIPGNSIEENIMEAIQSSRKVILVLSKAFLTSQWCQFELEMSRIESFRRGYNMLVPVLLEPLNMEEMSTCLQWLIRQYTYLEWPDSEADKEEFWKNLRRVLVAPGKATWEINKIHVRDNMNH